MSKRMDAQHSLLCMLELEELTGEITWCVGSGSALVPHAPLDTVGRGIDKGKGLAASPHCLESGSRRPTFQERMQSPLL